MDPLLRLIYFFNKPFTISYIQWYLNKGLGKYNISCNSYYLRRIQRIFSLKIIIDNGNLFKDFISNNTRMKLMYFSDTSYKFGKFLIETVLPY